MLTSGSIALSYLSAGAHGNARDRLSRRTARKVADSDVDVYPFDGSENDGLIPFIRQFQVIWSWPTHIHMRIDRCI